MPVETTTFISGLNSSNPVSTGPISQGDDHIRLSKATLLSTFLGMKRTAASWIKLSASQKMVSTLGRQR